MPNNDFRLSIRDELINTQNLRFKFTIQKIIFIISLMGFGVIDIAIIEFANFYYLIYLVPIVSIIFDLYIIGENFGIRRIGNYLKFTSNDKDEKYWEFLLNIPQDANRDLFAIHGNKLSSIVAILLSALALIIFKISNEQTVYFVLFIPEIIWSVIVWIGFYIIWYIYPKKMDQKTYAFNRSLWKYKDNWNDKIKEEEEIYKRNSDLKQIKQEIIKKYDQIL